MALSLGYHGNIVDLWWVFEFGFVYKYVCEDIDKKSICYVLLAQFADWLKKTKIFILVIFLKLLICAG